MYKKDVIYIHTMEYYSAIKKNEIISFAATWMDLEITVLSEIRKIKYYIAYIWNLKKWYKWIYRVEGLTYLENELMVTRGEGLGGVTEFGYLGPSFKGHSWNICDPSQVHFILWYQNTGRKNLLNILNFALLLKLLWILWFLCSTVHILRTRTRLTLPFQPSSLTQNQEQPMFSRN